MGRGRKALPEKEKLVRKLARLKKEVDIINSKLNELNNVVEPEKGI